MKLNRNTTALLLAASMAATASPVFAEENTGPAADTVQTEETAPAQETTESQTPAQDEKTDQSADAESAVTPADPADTEQAPADQTEPAEPEPETEAAEPEAEEASEEEAASAQKTLQEQISEAQDGDVITLQEDCTEPLTISGKSLTLNLNGHSIAASVANGAAAVTIKDSNTVTLTGTGTITTNGTGMGIHASDSALTIDGPTVSGNKITGNGLSGAGVTVTRGSLHFVNGTITGNEVTSNGAGGLMLDSCGFVMESGASVTDNKAWTGSRNSAVRPTGGIKIHHCQDALINGGTVSGNTGFYTGALFMDNSGSSLTIETGTFSDNQGGLAGGIITERDTLTIHGGQYTGNHLIEGPWWNNNADAGAIGCCDGTLVIDGTAPGGVMIENNTTRGTGGGIFVEGDCATTITGNVIIEHNTAGTNGGGLMASAHPDCAPDVTISGGVIIDNNTAGKAGADIFASPASGNSPAATLHLVQSAPEKNLEEDQTPIDGWYRDEPDSRWTKEFSDSYWDRTDNRQDPQAFSGTALKAAHGVKAMVAVFLQDKDGNNLKVIDPEFFDKGAAYDMKDQIPETLNQDGKIWKLVSMPEDAAGKATKETTNITATYELARASLSWMPVDENGKPLQDETEVLKDEESGTAYDLEKDIPETLTLDGKTWKLETLPENAKGTLGDKDVVVKPVYRQVLVSVSVQPVDENGDPIGDPTVALKDGNPSGDYDVQKQIPETFTDSEGTTWKLVKMPSDSKGTLGDRDLTVKAVYQKVTAPAKPEAQKPSKPSDSSQSENPKETAKKPVSSVKTAGKTSAKASKTTARKPVSTSVSTQAYGLAGAAVASLGALFFLNRRKKH